MATHFQITGLLAAFLTAAVGCVACSRSSQIGGCEDLIQRKCVEVAEADCNAKTVHSTVLNFSAGNSCVRLGYPSVHPSASTKWVDLAGAARMGDLERAKQVLAAHPELAGHIDELGKTALHYAAAGGNTKLAEFLISNRVPVNIKDKSGHSPIYYAIESNDIEMERLLRSNGGG